MSHQPITPYWKDILANDTNATESLSSLGAVGESATQTLTNKTISGASNTLSAIAGSSLNDASVTAAKIDLTGTFDFGSGLLRAATPVSASDAATKSYVDSVSQGLYVKQAVKAASAAALPAVTYSNGSSGVGATLTENANGAIPLMDDVALSVNDRVLIKDQATTLQNGCYVVTALGDASNPFVLTRSTDFDVSAEITDGSFFFVQEGTANGDQGYVMITNGSITVGTSPIVFTQSSGAGQITAGEGLSKSGNTLNVNVDNSTLEISTDNLQVKNSGISYSKIQNVSATDKILGRSSSGSGVVEEIACTAAGRALLDDADASAQRTTIGLGNVDNTSDANKPVSGAQQSALDLKLTKPTFVNVTNAQSPFTASINTIILVDATDGNVTINLPASATLLSNDIGVKRVDISVNTVTVDANGSETIDGSLTATLTQQYEFKKFSSNGTAVYIV